MQDTGTREVILAAASELYASRGYDAVSMRDVAASVHFKPASLYHHFKDKEDLVRESLAYVFAEKTASMESVLEAGHSPQERLDLFVDWFVRLIFTDPIFARLMSRELLDGNDERLEYLSRTVLSKPFSLLTRTISEVSAEEKPALTASSVVAMILGYYQLSGILTHLSDDRIESSEPERLIAYFSGLLRRMLNSSAKD